MSIGAIIISRLHLVAHAICENDTDDAATKQSEQIIGVNISSRTNVANLLAWQHISSSDAFGKRRMGLVLSRIV